MMIQKQIILLMRMKDKSFLTPSYLSLHEHTAVASTWWFVVPLKHFLQNIYVFSLFQTKYFPSV